MTDLETSLRARLHEHLDAVEPGTALLRGVPVRAAQLRRRRTATVAGAAAVLLLAGAASTFALTHDSRREAPVVADGTSRPARSDLSGRAEEYAEHLSRGDYAAVRGDMTPDAREILTEQSLRDAWRSVFGDRSPTQFEAYLESRTGDRPVVAVHVVEDAEPRATLYVIYDDARDISGLVLLDQAPDITWSREAVRAHGVLSQLRDGAFDAVRRDFDATMQAGLSEGRLASTWQQVVDTYGPVEVTNGHLETRSPTGHRVVDVVIHLRDAVVKLRVAFDDEQRIAGLFVLPLGA